MNTQDILNAMPSVAGLRTLLNRLAGERGGSITRREPMDTAIRSVDGTNVVFQYGRPVPSFETWRQDNQVREYVDLTGTWTFRFGERGADPAEIGIDDEWYAPSYDDTDWQDVDVPLPWDLYDTPEFDTYDGSIYGEGTAFRDGYGWYRKRVSIDAAWAEKDVKLNVLGAFYSARIYVNGTLVGEHEGGHTPFSLAIGDHLEEGENVLAVRVYRHPRFDDYTADEPVPTSDDYAVPPNPVDWWPYAGLVRDVYLEATDQVTVSKLLVDAADGEATVRAVVSNHGEETATRVVRLAPGEGTGGAPVDSRLSIGSDEVRVVEETISIPDAEWWSPRSPVTYEASATLYLDDESGRTVTDKASASDTLSARYGMRTVDVRDATLLVNGERVFLRGVNWHEETGQHGRSMTEQEYDHHFQRVQTLNANVIRNSHYNRHPYVYEYADENGLFVLDEVENMWLTAEQQAIQLEYGLSRALATTMAWNQYNRPSVVMWFLQNESEIWKDRGTYRNWLEDMKEAIKTVDHRQDRPVTWAAGSTSDHAYDIADVLGNNEYFGYFYKENDDLAPALESMHRRYPETPVLVTENGTWSRPKQRGGDPGDPNKRGTEAWHANYFEEHWAQVVDEPHVEYVCGYVFWALKDYKHGEDYNRFTHNGISTMGLLNFDDPELTTHHVFDTVADAYEGEVTDDGAHTSGP